MAQNIALGADGTRTLGDRGARIGRIVGVVGAVVGAFVLYFVALRMTASAATQIFGDMQVNLVGLAGLALAGLVVGGPAGRAAATRSAGAAIGFGALAAIVVLLFGTMTFQSMALYKGYDTDITFGENFVRMFVIPITEVMKPGVVGAGVLGVGAGLVFRALARRG